MYLNSKWHNNENKQKFHFNGCEFLFIFIKSLWTLKWTTGFFLLTRNYVLKMFIILFALQPLHLLKLPLWAVVLFYTAWLLMTPILRKHFPIQEFTFKALMAQESRECLWGDIWQDTQHWPLVGQSCIESVFIFVLKLHRHFTFEED